MDNVTILIFGATGDLTRKKLIPALYALMRANKLPKKWIIIGAAVDAIDIHTLAEQARPFVKHQTDAQWHEFVECLFYRPVDFMLANDFVEFKQYVQKIESQWGISGNNRVAYLAAPSDYFCAITEHLATSNLIEPMHDHCSHRIVYEKPFGKDLPSAQAINACIARYFQEQQVYRIDHYLTKELVSNIALIRFTNCFFEPLWNNHYVSQVQIIVDEVVGIDGRGSYYDQYGALRDFVQNHILQLLALVAMEAPEKLSGEPMRDERLRVLRDVTVVDGLLGQYKGYLHERQVKPHSTTETFAMLCFMINNPRWREVPFYIKTGKCLRAKETVIHVIFKPVDCRLVRGCPIESNYITIRIDPDAGFSLHLNAKKPGSLTELMPVTMDFCHYCLLGSVTPSAYEVVLEEVLRGEQSIVVRFDEIEQAWRIIDEVRARNFPCYPYEKGSDGPVEAALFNQKHALRWLT